VGTTGYTVYGEIYEFLCHWWVGCWHPPGLTTHYHSDNPCVMWEKVPMSEGYSCLSEFGPPEFYKYQPCEGSPIASGTPNPNDNGPLNCILNAFYNDNVLELDDEPPVESKYDIIEWETRIWGDTHLHGRTVQKGEQIGESLDQYDIPISFWWFKTSPTCDSFCSFRVGVNRFGTKIINYHDDIDPMATLHSGRPENMHLSPYATFVGYVSEEVNSYG
jgi:hypothetical protein